MNRNYVTGCALDVGSRQIKASLGRYNRHKKLFEVLAVKRVLHTGIRSGVVVDMAACTQAIAEALKEIEIEAGVKFDCLFLTIAGSQVSIERAKGVCRLKKEKRITSREIEHAIQSSVEFYMPLDRKLIQLVVTEFIVDGQRGVRNPVGMFGKKLEAQTILLHSPLRIISNLVAAVEEAGYTTNELVFCSQAQAEFLLTAREKEDGAGLLDVGERAVNFSYFKGKFISEIRHFDAGIGDINKSVSSFFKIPYEYACRLNERYFSLAFDSNKGSEAILLDRENEKYESILKKDFCEKGAEASAELFAVIGKCLRRRGAEDNVVLLGGGSLVDGFLEKLEDCNSNLRLARPVSEEIKFLDPSFDNPLFLNSICACAYGLKLLNLKRQRYLDGRRLLGRFFLQIKDLLEEYF